MIYGNVPSNDASYTKNIGQIKPYEQAKQRCKEEPFSKQINIHCGNTKTSNNNYSIGSKQKTTLSLN